MSDAARSCLREYSHLAVGLVGSTLIYLTIHSGGRLVRFCIEKLLYFIIGTHNLLSDCSG